MPLDRWSKPTNTRDDAVINTLSLGGISVLWSTTCGGSMISPNQFSTRLSGSPLAR